VTVPAVSLTPRTDDGLGVGASAGALLHLASSADFHRWEQQLANTGNCVNPVRLVGRITATDRATGQAATMYDTAAEPGGVLLVPCGNRREEACPSCSQTYKNDARHIIRAGLTGGKDIPETVATHPCVFATLTAPSFGSVHTTRTDRRGRRLPCRPRRDANQRRCPHGRDISCSRVHHDGDPRLGQPMCPDCYDYTGHVLFNALAPELWRRFTIYLPRQLARLVGITQKRLRSEVRVRFVKVAEYQARGIIHYHAVIRLDAPGDDYRPPLARYGAVLLAQAITRAVAAVSYDTATLTATEASPRRILRFGTQIDPRPIVRATSGLPGPGTALSAQAVANYIAKYATKTSGAPARSDQRRQAAASHKINAHYRRLIATCWKLAEHPAFEQLALNRVNKWTHALGYRGHFLTKSRRYSASFTALRRARINYRRRQRHPGGEHDPWGRPLDDRIVLITTQWQYAGTGHGTTAERALALASAARAREHDRIAREETWMN
jgi:hypothetical protein